MTKIYEVWVQPGNDTLLVVNTINSSIRYQYDPNGEWRNATQQQWEELFNQKPLFDCRYTVNKRKAK